MKTFYQDFHVIAFACLKHWCYWCSLYTQLPSINKSFGRANIWIKFEENPCWCSKHTIVQANNIQNNTNGPSWSDLSKHLGSNSNFNPQYTTVTRTSMAHKATPLWDYFLLESTQLHIAWCNNCRMNISGGGKGRPSSRMEARSLTCGASTRTRSPQGWRVSMKAPHMTDKTLTSNLFFHVG